MAAGPPVDGHYSVHWDGRMVHCGGSCGSDLRISLGCRSGQDGICEKGGEDEVEHFGIVGHNRFHSSSYSSLELVDTMHNGSSHG